MSITARTLAVAVLLALCRPCVTLAAQLTPFLEGQRLGVTLSRVAVPQTIRSDLPSGLTNRILIQWTLLRDSQVIAHSAVDVAIKYDLWDETFLLTVSVDGARVVSRTLAHLDDVIAAISNLRVPGLIAIGHLPDNVQLQVTAQILFDPLEKARMDEVRKWVAENSAPPTGAPMIGTGVPPPAPPSESRSLFNRIFEEYAAGATVAATSKDSAASPLFKLKDLPREGQ